jgi:NADPH:quinone reductase-like Zn-dependent oxidoreductase
MQMFRTFALFRNSPGTKTMKALILQRYGGAKSVQFADLPRPTVKPDEILVQVHAAGLNPIDNMIPTGSFKPIIKLRLPATMGSDLAGVVVETGSQVTRFRVGDAVFASTFNLGVGALAEYAAVPEHAAALKPDNLDFVQAASIPMVGLTSWQALLERAQLQPGQKVFIPAGSGGIGSFAIQLAKLFGARVATTTSTANVEFVRHLGADEVIDYKTQKFEELLRDYDVVLVTLRGGELEKSLQLVGPGSQVVSLIGPPDAAFARKHRMNLLMQFVFSLLSAKIIRLAKRRKTTYSFLLVRPDGQQLAKIGEHLAASRLHPVVDRIFPFTQTKEGLAYLEQGRAKGKVVVELVKSASGS